MYLKHINIAFRSENSLSGSRGVAPWQQKDSNETTGVFDKFVILTLVLAPEVCSALKTTLCKCFMKTRKCCCFILLLGRPIFGLPKFFGKKSIYVTQLAIRFLLPLVRLSVAGDNCIKISRVLMPKKITYLNSRHIALW
jgi:hypothetical protein